MSSILITERDIKTRVKQLAEEISNDYKTKNINTINIIYVLSGAFMFTADLCRELHRNGVKTIIGMVRLKTYVGTEIKIKYPQIAHLFDYSLKGKNILIVEDILDTGNTINYLNESMMYYKPRSIEYCCLLRKKHNRCILKKNINVKYIGFTIPDVFAIGYGLDHDEMYRELPFIQKL